MRYCESKQRKKKDNRTATTKVRNDGLVFVLRKPQRCEATERRFSGLQHRLN